MGNNSGDVPGVITHPPIILAASMAVGAGIHQLAPLTIDVEWHRGIGLVIVALGFLLSLWSVIVLVMRGVNPDPFKPTAALITTGPYRFSRNPIYVAYLVMQAGIGVWIGWAWIVLTIALSIPALLNGAIRREERYLEERFGDAYVAYASGVRRWL